MPPTRPAPPRPNASRSICRPRAKPASCPTSTPSTTSCSRAPSRSISPRPSNPQGAVAERRLSRAAGRAGAALGFMMFADECYSEIYLQRPRAARHAEVVGAGFRQRRGVPLAVEALQPAGPARRLRGRRPAIPRAATSICATSPRRRCRCRRRRSRSRPTTTRRMSRRTARSIVAKFDLADQIIGNRYGYKRPAGGFFLWLDVVAARRRAKPRAASSGAKAGLRVVPGTISRATAPTAAIPATATSASRMVQDKRNHRRGAASPRRVLG